MLAGGADLELGCQEEGSGADATPDPQSSKLSCPRQDCPEATVTGLLKPERFPESARRQDQGGNWRPSYLFLPHPSRPRTAPPSESTTRSQRQGFANGRAGPAIRIPPSRPDAHIR